MIIDYQTKIKVIHMFLFNVILKRRRFAQVLCDCEEGLQLATGDWPSQYVWYYLFGQR